MRRLLGETAREGREKTASSHHAGAAVAKVPA